MVAALVAFYLVAPNQTQALPLSASEENPGNRWSTINEGVIQERLERIPLPFEVRYNAKVRYYIKDYVATGYKQTQSILGRSLMYFPIFEHYLTIRGLPKELMYLPIVESGLNPTAKSPVGAAGLWQLMYSTAKQYGLKINGNVDERLDPYRSTEAAVEMLAELYKEFKDWRLVLAAYNCGPGRVQQAIRAANSRDYWKLEQYLPAQTQRYVPAFVAAAYVVHYYDQHNLRPTYSALNLRETRVLKVYHTLTFQEIASACGLPPATIELLNPGYIRKVVPKNDKGNFLILPANSVAVFKDFLAGKAIANVGSVPSNMFKSTYVVAKGDRIEKLASLFQCSVEDIMKWNGLSEPEVFVNQELIVFLPNQILSKRA